jgi:hypothetical protein
MLENFNAVTRRVATELDVVLVDLAYILPKSTEIFYDDSHFTVAGAQEVAEEIARTFANNASIQARIKLPRL